MRDTVTLKLYTHWFDDEDRVHSKLHEVLCTREAAPRIVSAFYEGEGSTSVHEDTLLAFPQED